MMSVFCSAHSVKTVERPARLHLLKLFVHAPGMSELRAACGFTSPCASGTPTSAHMHAEVQDTRCRHGACQRRAALVREGARVPTVAVHARRPFVMRMQRPRLHGAQTRRTPSSAAPSSPLSSGADSPDVDWAFFCACTTVCPHSRAFRRPGDIAKSVHVVAHHLNIMSHVVHISEGRPDKPIQARQPLKYVSRFRFITSLLHVRRPRQRSGWRRGGGGGGGGSMSAARGAAGRPAPQDTARRGCEGGGGRAA